MSEHEQIQQIVDSVPKPPYVDEIKLELIEDWTGDPALLIYVIMTDEEVAGPNFFEDADAFRWVLKEAQGVPRFAHVYFRGRSEENDLLQGAA